MFKACSTLTLFVSFQKKQFSPVAHESPDNTKFNLDWSRYAGCDFALSQIVRLIRGFVTKSVVARNFVVEDVFLKLPTSFITISTVRTSAYNQRQNSAFVVDYENILCG